ncbi:MAG: leucyl/phenylalanyl-tRNA--protein transferase [Desulfobacterales bacterium]|nr:MAG: leucyl/phenylalanyl-tRNA--protein transferase [Desulfobacterales bacterium]UCD91423.1 MAG: leucyl/phenylalanyl-tRNA--protein transferase [Desulfobacterales bacterium]
MPVFLLSDDIVFPSPHLASKEGLLAVGGDLTQERLLLAYRMGIFPWFSNNEPIMWWSPDPRLVLFLEDVKISRTLNKIIKKKMFHVTMDSAFGQVINQCAQVRLQNNQATWIVEEMIDAYCKLHELGFAHSVEAWYQGELAGGLYGVSLGGSFFGESMFTRISNASNITFVKLVEYLLALSFDMIDCQIATEHFIRFGAKEIPRAHYLKKLNASLKRPTLKGRWTLPT